MNKETDKVINYIVLVDDVHHYTFASLAEARKCVKDFNKVTNLEQSPEIIQIIKREIKDTVLNTYKPTTTVSYVTAEDLMPDFSWLLLGILLN